MGKIYKSTDRKLPSELRKFFDEACQKRHVMSSLVCKGVAADQPMTIAAIANHVNPDRGMETIDPEAWDLTNYMKNPIVLYEHDYRCPIGYTTEIEAKDDGLYYSAVIGDPKSAPLTQLQIDVRSLLAQGILKANSVGFLPHVIEYDEDKDLIRYTNVELLEISIVSVPMQQDSLITNIKGWREKAMSEKNKNKGADAAAGDEGSGDKKPDAVMESLADMHKKVDQLGQQCKDMHDYMKSIGDKIKPADAADPAEPDADDKKRIADLEAKVAELETEKKEIEEETAGLLEDLRKAGTIE